VNRQPAKLRLDELILARDLAETRSQAQRLIMAGQVLVDDAVSDKPGRRVAENCHIRVKQRLRYVSRGGLKLEAALAEFGISPVGWACADIGASTGGFSDCMLQHGAAKVYAVDVGYGQLAWSLRTDPRVVVMERVNIRHMEALPEKVALTTVDVSFIGLGLVLPRVAELLTPDGQILALIKPQFEVGKGKVGKGGVVRDPLLHRAVIERVLADAQEMGLTPEGLIRSPITGPAGNVEFLVRLRLNAEFPSSETVSGWIDLCTAKGRSDNSPVGTTGAQK
jgi:23S rRNA (cytidine1920-2'-O)/16S rRNA (cytidine1409-2'-O)-methyltransferase